MSSNLGQPTFRECPLWNPRGVKGWSCVSRTKQGHQSRDGWTGERLRPARGSKKGLWRIWWRSARCVDSGGRVYDSVPLVRNAESHCRVLSNCTSRNSWTRNRGGWRSCWLLLKRNPSKSFTRHTSRASGFSMVQSEKEIQQYRVSAHVLLLLWKRKNSVTASDVTPPEVSRHWIACPKTGAHVWPFWIWMPESIKINKVRWGDGSVPLGKKKGAPALKTEAEPPWGWVHKPFSILDQRWSHRLPRLFNKCFFVRCEWISQGLLRMPGKGWEQWRQISKPNSIWHKHSPLLQTKGNVI